MNTSMKYELTEQNSLFAFSAFLAQPTFSVLLFFNAIIDGECGERGLGRVYVCVCVCVEVYIYIYIYIYFMRTCVYVCVPERERERERCRGRDNV